MAPLQQQPPTAPQPKPQSQRLTAAPPQQHLAVPQQPSTASQPKPQSQRLVPPSQPQHPAAQQSQPETQKKVAPLPGYKEPDEDPSGAGIRTLQMQALSRSFDMPPLMPDVPGLECQFIYEINSSQNVEFLDFINISETAVGIILINIEKSLPALFTQQLKDFILTAGPGFESPKEFLQKIGELFLGQYPISIPMKAAYLIIDVQIT